MLPGLHLGSASSNFYWKRLRNEITSLIDLKSLVEHMKEAEAKIIVFY